MRGRAYLPCATDRTFDILCAFGVEKELVSASNSTKMDAELRAETKRIWCDNQSVNGARKLWHATKRQSHDLACFTVERLLCDIILKLSGVAGRLSHLGRTKPCRAHKIV